MGSLSVEDLDMDQVDAFDYVNSRDKCGLFLLPGKGKTVVALMWAKERLDDLKVHKVLVIAPRLVVRDVWGDEHNNWHHLAGLRVQTVAGSEQKRLKSLRTPAEIYAINPENVAWLVRTNKFTWNFDAIIVDESDYFQNHKAIRFRELQQHAHDTRYVMIMTGTPIGNSYQGLWAQVNLIDEAHRLGHNISRYRAAFFTEQVMGFRREYTIDEAGRCEISRLISPICYSIPDDSEECFPREVYTHITTLTGRSRRLYDQMSEELLIEIDSEQVVALNAAVKAGKLLQIASGCVYSSIEPGELPSSRKTLVIHDRKLQKVAEIARQADSPVLVFYNFISERDALLGKFPQAVDVRSRKDTVQDWNAGLIPMLIAHPKSAGHGLNLQRGGHVLIFLGLPWAIRQYVQAVGRLARKGQPHVVQVHHILCKDSMDEYVSSRLKGHKETASRFLAGLRQTLIDQMSGNSYTEGRG